MEIIVVVIILLIITIVLGITIPILVINEKYKSFVLEHSVALKQLKTINKSYQFKTIPNFNMQHAYDNRHYYSSISCKDYLTYQLVFIKKQVNEALKDTLVNKRLFEDYKQEIKDTCVMDRYDMPILLKNRSKLIRYEKRLFNKEIKVPTVSFFISVRLYLTNINGVYLDSKQSAFFPKEIKDIIFKLNRKNGDFYLDSDVWQSICRVERGKVTNKMRFAIYDRDHHRCRKCGRRTKDLEIDHIIPIAKGGKSTLDNLQTLCHTCNYNKGTQIE